ncbi:MAG: outer membrane protein assembly factor BamB [Verrucomicrobiaceae bacterium]|nr:outer membrane protein assembly factor BamB [Verrucomicrobiaceae bacterium]
MSMQFIVRKSFRATVLLLALGAIAACSSNKDKDQEPAPLPDFKAERSFDKLWSHGVGNGQGKLYNRLAPVVHDKKIFAAAANGKVEAFDRISGKSLWDADIDVPVSGGVGVGGGLVLVASEDGRVWALNEETGKTLWKTQLGGQILSAPQSDGTFVVALTFSGDVVGLDAKTGAIKWAYAGTAPVLSLRASSTPIIVDGTVLAGLANGKVVALEIASGRALWEVRVGIGQGSSEIERQVDVSGDLLVDDDTLYAVSYQGRLTAIELRSGRRLWENNASSYVGLSTDVSNIYVVGATGNVTAFTKSSRGVRWEQTALARRQLSGSAVLGNYVAFGDYAGYLHLLSQLDGHFVARTRVDSDGLRVAPLVVDDILYVYGNSGDLEAYKLEKK